MFGCRLENSREVSAHYAVLRFTRQAPQIRLQSCE
jgi:hypothetical protein